MSFWGRLVRHLWLIWSSGLLNVVWKFNLTLTCTIISFLLLCRSRLLILILINSSRRLLRRNYHEIVFEGFCLIPNWLLLIVAEVLILLLWITCISHHNFSVVYRVVACVRWCHFAGWGRLILILLVCTQVMVGRRSSIEIILSIFLFKILYFLKYLLRILNVCLLKHSIWLNDLIELIYK